jgi:uncharacterized membrane protein
MLPSRLAYIIVLAGVLLWCAGFLAAPLLAGPDPGHDFLYRLYGRVCHQLDDRSLPMGGGTMAVCSRCASIYLAFLFGTLLYPLIRRVDHPDVPPKWVIALALAPMLVDVAGGILGLTVTTNATRLVTGSVFGLLMPFVIIPVASRAMLEMLPPSTVSTSQQKGTADA